MSAESNAGILMYASQGAAVAGSVAIPVNTGTLSSPRSVPVGIAQRVILTIAYKLTNPTTGTIRARLTNNSVFLPLNTPSSAVAPPGSAVPGTVSGGGSTNANLNVPIPVLSVAQNDAQAGFQAIDHAYGPGVGTDFIFLVGSLAGALDVLLTIGGGNSTAGDYFIVAANLY